MSTCNENAVQEWALHARQNSHLWIIREEVVAFPRSSSCLHERGISHWKLALWVSSQRARSWVNGAMTGKDYQHGEGSSIIIKSFVNSW